MIALVYEIAGVFRSIVERKKGRSRAEKSGRPKAAR
jgi:hypothetical protein